MNPLDEFARPFWHLSASANAWTMENLEEVADREEAERQQSLRDLEQLYEWLQQFEDPPPAPRPPPPQQFRNGSFYYGIFVCSFYIYMYSVHAIEQSTD